MTRRRRYPVARLWRKIFGLRRLLLEIGHGGGPLDTQESNYDLWLQSIVRDVTERLIANLKYTKGEAGSLVQLVEENVRYLLAVETLDGKLADKIWNQELVDLVRKTALFTAFGSPNRSVDLYAEFNRLAVRLCPLLIQRLDLSIHSDVEKLARYAIAAGLCGLDLKGSVVASSDYAQEGMALSKVRYSSLSAHDVDQLAEVLTGYAQGPAPLFQLDELLAHFTNPDSSPILWLTDDLIESYFDLLFIGSILLKNQHVSVIIVPKNGCHGNDLSWQQLELLLKNSVFSALERFIGNGRIRWTRVGPRMGCLISQRMSNELRHLFTKASTVFVKGCRSFELIQGGILRPMFSAQVVTRRFSEVVSGYDTASTPLLLFGVRPVSTAITVRIFPG